MEEVVFTPTCIITPPLHICVQTCNKVQSKVTMTCGIYVDRCVRGYHTYQDLWDTAVGEELLVRKIES